MNAQCRCPHSAHGPYPIGTSLGNGVVGNWESLPEDNRGNAPHALRNCECGCNAYSPSLDPGEFPSGHSEGLSDIPALPLTVEYENDDGPSDDHEYISIKITELSDMVSAIKSCTCQDH